VFIREVYEKEKTVIALNRLESRGFRMK